MKPDLFSHLFDLQDARLNTLGDPLEEMSRMVDWEAFRPRLKRVHAKRNESNKGNKPKDEVMMFKALIIQSLYGMSDEQLEYQIEDRRSFQRFLGLGNHERAPDAKTFWSFREQLMKLKMFESLFTSFNEQLERAGFSARRGQIVDASLVRVPIQRNSREENKQIKAGEVPEDWETNKQAQKDIDARWTKKNGKSTYGYKNHIGIDREHKLIRTYEVSDASVHDSVMTHELVDENNSSKDFWADSAYRSREIEKRLKEKGYRSKIHHKGKRNKPLSEFKKQINTARSRVRCRVEHVFAAQRNWREKSIRSIGIARARLGIGMMNLREPLLILDERIVFEVIMQGKA